MLEIKIRPYYEADRNSVINLWNQVFPGTSIAHNDPATMIDQKNSIGDSLLLVAEKSGETVGTVMGGWDGHRGWIYALAVAPTHQRQGIGRILVQRIEKELAHRGCPKINLQVRADNEAVVSFYQALGYETEPRISMGKLLSD